MIRRRVPPSIPPAASVEQPGYCVQPLAASPPGGMPLKDYSPFGVTTSRRRFLAMAAASVAASAYPFRSVPGEAPSQFPAPTRPLQAFLRKCSRAMARRSARRRSCLPPTLATGTGTHSSTRSIAPMELVVSGRVPRRPGRFERTCRDLSGDPDFALPFWDGRRNRVSRINSSRASSIPRTLPMSAAIDTQKSTLTIHVGKTGAFSALETRARSSSADSERYGGHGLHADG